MLQSVFSVIVSLVLMTSVGLAETKPATTIQELIDAAAPGDEILVPAGEYTGVLHVRDGIFLRGASGGSITLDGAGAGQVVTLGKNSAIIGFTIRNGGILVANAGNFSGVFECSLVDYHVAAIAFQGGSGVVANNRIDGAAGKTGILSAGANPVITHNLIEGNTAGVQVHPHLIPVLSDNLFRGNTMAIQIIGEAQALVERNFFDGNEQALTSGTLPDSNITGPLAPEDFVLALGGATDAYRDLMRETFGEAVKDHPLVIYDLNNVPGSFDVLGLFPWATFTLSASTLDTTIESFHAYDMVSDQPLQAAYQLENGQRPSVRVNNPELVEKMRERYVLENRYVHAPSYFENEQGQRVFKRHTNVSQIEIVLPAGYSLVSVYPDGELRTGFERPYVSISDVGDTFIELVLEKSP